jgi:hypothetical protein
MNERWNRLVPPRGLPTAHLGDAELVATELTGAAEKHLSNCVWCQTRRNVPTETDRDELEELLSALDASPMPAEALQLAGSFALPAALSHALEADISNAPEVEPAQLWRLVWRGHDALAVVLERNSWWVTVAPLSTDVKLADEYTAVCDADATSLGCQTAVFMRAATTVPQYTLALYLGDVQPAGVANAANELHNLHVASINQSSPQSGLPTGRPLQVDDWDRQQVLDAFREQMSWFEAATQDVIDDNGDIVGGDATADLPDGDHQSIEELLRRPGLDLMDLSTDTQIRPDRILDLTQGSGRPTPEERTSLETYFGVTISGAYPEAARRALLEIASEPTHRHLWLISNTAESGGQAPDTLRPFLEHMLTQNVAARTVNGSGHDTDAGLTAWRAYWRDKFAVMK